MSNELVGTKQYLESMLGFRSRLAKFKKNTIQKKKRYEVKIISKPQEYSVDPTLSGQATGSGPTTVIAKARIVNKNSAHEVFLREPSLEGDESNDEQKKLHDSILRSLHINLIMDKENVASQGDVALATLKAGTHNNIFDYQNANIFIVKDTSDEMLKSQNFTFKASSAFDVPNRRLVNTNALPPIPVIPFQTSPTFEEVEKGGPIDKRFAYIGDSQGNGILPILRNYIIELEGEVVYEISNGGWSITTYNGIDYGKDRLFNELADAEPDFVIIELGTNSSGLGISDPDFYAEQMRDWVDRIRDLGAEVLWVGPARGDQTKATLSNYPPSTVEGYYNISDVQEEVSGEQNFAWLDSRNYTDTGNSHDGIHFNNTGYRQWADAILNFIARNARQ